MTAIFVTVPVTDLGRATTYYTALGCTVDPAFSGPGAACFVWDEGVRLMAATRETFATLTDRAVVDPRQGATALLSLGLGSRAEVDTVAEAALGAGGTAGDPQDLEPMYARDVFDPDGNGIQLMFIEPDAADPQASRA
jgi:predicted lactoylglutathione lyase